MSGDDGRPWRLAEDGLLLLVRAQPGAKRAGIGGVRQTEQGPALEVKVNAPPEKGKANKAIVALLAKALKVPKSALVVERGESSRVKRIRIAGAGEALARKLEALVQEAGA